MIVLIFIQKNNMAQAFTPGLTRAAGLKIVKTRRLPLLGETLFKVGDEVSAEDVVARTELPGPVSVLKISHRLGCQPSELKDFMSVKEGDEISDGQVIAQSKGFMGFFKSEFKSNTNGTIESISKVNGQAYVRGEPIPVEMKGYINGKIIEVMKNEGVKVETVATMVQGIFGVGGETGGTLVFGVKSPEEILSPSGITSEMKDKIVVAGACLRQETIKKAKEVGVRGLVGGALHDKDLRSFLGYDIGVAITGNENIGITLITTEGFGELQMDSNTWALLNSCDGKRASINGATQIRAGVLRPEIIIPTPEVKSEKSDSGAGSLEKGTKIVVIRNPYFGMTGTVSELIVEPQRLESEAKVRVLKVKFEDGKEAIVPRANIERLAS